MDGDAFDHWSEKAFDILCLARSFKCPAGATTSVHGLKLSSSSQQQHIELDYHILTYLL